MRSAIIRIIGHSLVMVSLTVWLLNYLLPAVYLDVPSPRYGPGLISVEFDSRAFKNVDVVFALDDQHWSFGVTITIREGRYEGRLSVAGNNEATRAIVECLLHLEIPDVTSVKANNYAENWQGVHVFVKRSVADDPSFQQSEDERSIE